MKNKPKLDPTVKAQLQAPSGHETEVQHLLENPQKIASFMDFRVDWAFKFILGHEEILVKLLNDILPVHVDSIEYLPNEIPVFSEKDKRSVFDVVCTNATTKEKFLCEMQQYPDADMNDRLLFYGCSLLHRQIERGNDDYLLSPVYVICISDYIRPHTAFIPQNHFFFHYTLKEKRLPQDELTDKLQFYFLEIPRLEKMWETAETNTERWCYLFGNLSNFADVPKDQAGFESVFAVADTRELDNTELKEYLSAMLTDYDKHVYGKYNREEGMKEGRREVLRALIDSGMPVSELVQRLNLSEEEAKELAR